MLFTWNTKNLCIVFRQWHVTSTASLIVSLLLVVAIGVGYEALREGIRRYEVSVNKRADTAPRKYLYPRALHLLHSLPSPPSSVSVSINCSAPFLNLARIYHRVPANPALRLNPPSSSVRNCY